nr:PAS domain-containing protein [Marinicella sp. W31]MDC2876664.1 PAS domain-containing protein [Marinicella sp. W31]
MAVGAGDDRRTPEERRRNPHPRAGLFCRYPFPKTQEALESERARRWNYALVSSGLGVWDHDYRRREHFYSQTWRSMRGYASTGATPFASTQEWLQMVHPDDREFVAYAIERQKAGDLKFMNFEYRERHCHGHWIWIECRGDAVEFFPTTGLPASSERITISPTVRMPRPCLPIPANGWNWH